MSDGPGKLFPRRELLASGGADTLVSRALSVVASREGVGRMSRDDLYGEFLDRLGATLTDPERGGRRALVAEMRRSGIPWEEVADRYIPSLARRLGEQWCDDEISFADVTIGTARLQAMLRDLGPEWSEERVTDCAAPSLLFAVSERDHHTLGPMVAAGQLRRRGASVRLVVGQPDAAIVDQAARGRYDAIMLSASCSVKLETVRNLVKMLGKVASAPIVLGGTILETDRDARAFTCVDHATSDPLEALKLCGLKVPRSSGSVTGIGT